MLLPVLRAMGSSTAAVRYNAADALGEWATRGRDAADGAARSAQRSARRRLQRPRNHIFVGKQVAYVQDFDVEVAQFASVADPQINTLIEGAVLDVRVIGAYETSTSIESRHVRSSLGELTGASPGSSNRAWMEWWAQNRSRYETPAKPSGPATHELKPPDIARAAGVTWRSPPRNLWKLSGAITPEALQRDALQIESQSAQRRAPHRRRRAGPPWIIAGSTMPGGSDCSAILSLPSHPAAPRADAERCGLEATSLE